MNKIFKILSVFLLLISAFLISSCDNQDNFLYVAISPDYAPYEFIDKTQDKNNKYVGSDVSFAKYIAKKLDKNLVIEAMGFSETLASVQNGRVDLAISGFTYEKERAQNYELSNSYYDDGDGEQVIITLKENKEKYNTLEKINQPTVRIASQVGTTQSALVKEQLPNAINESVDTVNNGVLWLKNGKVDCVAIAMNAAATIMASNTDIVVCDEKFSSIDSGLHVIAKKGNVELISKVNDIILEVKENNLYEQWISDAIKLYESLGNNASEEDLTVNDNFFLKMYHMFVDNFKGFMRGLGITLLLSILSVLLASIFGALLCLMNISNIKIFKILSNIYIEIVRGIPLLLQLTLIFLLMPKGMSKFITCVIALVINSSAYQAEIFRAGIQAVDKGQMEAARCLGMSYPKAMIKVILPQAIKNVLPSLANEFVSLIKETSLASTFYVGDLMTIKTIISSSTYDTLTPYIIIAIIYFIITFSLSKLIKKVEMKVAY